MTPDYQEPNYQDLDLRPAPPKPAAPDPQAETSAPDDAAGLSLPPAPKRRALGPRAILFAGVAGACVLGVGLGLWARPAMNERRVAVAKPEPEAPPSNPDARRLKIVVGDGPAAPVGDPIETLRQNPRPLFATLRPRQGGQAVMGQVPELTRLEPKPLQKLAMPHLQAPQLQALKVEGPRLPDLAPLMAVALAAPGHWLSAHALSGLKPPARPADTAVAEIKAPPSASTVRRLQVAEAEDRAAKAAQAEAARDAAREAQARAEADAQAQAQKATARRAELAAAAAHAQQVKLAQAAAEAAAAAKVQAAQLAQAKAGKARVAEARLEQARADKAEKLRLAKAERAEALKLAQAEARGRAQAREAARAEAKAMVLAEARDEARKRQRLEALVAAVRKVLPHGRPAEVEAAKLDRRHPGKAHPDLMVERASTHSRKAPHMVEPANRSHPVQLAPADPSGLVKVSTTPRCASRDPGAALVCGDPTLSAADRQLARAYQGARAAGVPESQLQAQQQRWLAARSAAARDAPWAVRDVYLARIAELNSQARDAHADGY